MRVTALFAAQLALLLPALAQDASAQSRGAIRALGHTHHRHHAADKGVEIPRYVPTVRPAADQLPPGTTRPGRSRSFRPAY